MLNRLLRLAALALACTLAAAPALADYPDKPVRLVVPFPPGGATDIMARLLADRLREVLGQQVLVENKPGAGTMIASDQVARSPADGYTVLLAGTPFVIAEAVPRTPPRSGRQRAAGFRAPAARRPGGLRHRGATDRHQG